MKIRTIAVATVFALSSPMAFAQMGGNDAGDAVPERSGTVVNGNGAAVRTVDPAGVVQADKTTGMAPVRPATPGVAPGARDKSRTGGQGVSDRPAGN